MNKLNEAINKIISEFTVPDSVHTFMMRLFNKQYNAEAKNRNSVLQTKQKAYNDCLANIDGLIDMRARGLIGDEIFKSKVSPLEKLKSKLFEVLSDTDKRADDWIEKAKDFGVFVEYAIKQFNEGDLQRRKTIFASLGQNLVLKDKELFVDLEDSLVPMKTVKKEADAIHERLEPLKRVIKQEQLEQYYSKSPKMLRDQDSNLEPSP